MPKKIDAKKWIRNEADKLAVANGCVMDLTRGEAVCQWIEEYCRLYEGRDAGKPFTLMSWQRDCLMRIFGWMRPSTERTARKVHEHIDAWRSDNGRDASPTTIKKIVRDVGTVFVRRFRVANIWVSKKNGKTPLLAAIGLYCLCGDREQGQKCFSVARDGKQAMLQQQHAIQMVLASEVLSDPSQCVINKSTAQIAYLPTNSFYRVVAGDNTQGQQGLNGSCFVDELHVVDAELMSVLEYAGRSRDEPLQMGVSTAGKNPDSYGKQQFDYGRAVNSGAVPDERFFHQEYVVPDDVTDKEFEEDAEKYLRMANPSIGTTVFLEELLADYAKAKRSLAALAEFKMYTCGQWQNAQNPWLNMGAWLQCGRSIPSLRRDLCNHSRARRQRTPLEAYLALDLSKVSDMSAACLAVPIGNRIALLVRLWITEVYARLNNHLVRTGPTGMGFLEWAKAGYLTLVPGSEMDYGIVRAGVRKMCRGFSVLQEADDGMYAAATGQELQEGIINPDTGEVFEEGFGFERIMFPQTPASYGVPSEDFEAGLLSITILHEANPCVAWQVGHVEVHETNGNKKPVKPRAMKGEELSYKKIDAIQAMVMAHALAVRAIRARVQGAPEMSSM